MPRTTLNTVKATEGYFLMRENGRVVESRIRNKVGMGFDGDEYLPEAGMGAHIPLWENVYVEPGCHFSSTHPTDSDQNPKHGDFHYRLRAGVRLLDGGGGLVDRQRVVAERLGNTRAVCRKYYIHPALIDAYMRGETVPEPPPVAGHYGCVVERVNVTVLE